MSVDLLWTCLVVMLAMAAQDVLGTVLTIAEARGKDRLAGLMDAGGDVARAVTNSVAVDAILHGVGLHSVLVLATLAVTSYNTTRQTTKWARTHLQQECSHCGILHKPGDFGPLPDSSGTDTVA